MNTIPSGPSVISIVIIDDHQIVREGLVAMINSQQDMQVVGSCGDPATGLTMIQDKSPDIVITDISMPEGTPFEMVKVAKEQLPRLKVIFLTAFTTDGNLERALRSGGEGFISKNEPLDYIIDGINEVHLGNSFFSEEIRLRLVHNTHGEPTASTDSISNIQQDELKARKELLSPRETEVLCCVARGMTAKQIAGALHISAKTVERHKSNIMTKLKIHSQVDLARYAIREGLIAP